MLDIILMVIERNWPLSLLMQATTTLEDEFYWLFGLHVVYDPIWPKISL